MLSVIIPARDEAASIGETLRELTVELDRKEIAFEVVVVDDASVDRTAAIVEAIARDDRRVRLLPGPAPSGFGSAVRAGLEAATGEALAVVMADGCDDPADLVRYHELLGAGWDCAFGTRFGCGARLGGYPRAKLVQNRLGNLAIRLAFGHGYDDTTNAFKAYRRHVLDDVGPLRARHFELTAELPLKAIIRGHSFAVVPIAWRGRRAGRSKFGPGTSLRYVIAVARLLGERRARHVAS